MTTPNPYRAILPLEGRRGCLFASAGLCFLTVWGLLGWVGLVTVVVWLWP